MNKPRMKRAGCRVFFKDYSMPDARSEEYAEAQYAARYGEPSKKQIMLLLAASEAYDHFVLHPATTESIIKQLREVRREFR